MDGEAKRKSRKRRRRQSAVGSQDGSASQFVASSQEAEARKRRRKSQQGEQPARRIDEPEVACSADSSVLGTEGVTLSNEVQKSIIEIIDRRTAQLVNKKNLNFWSKESSALSKIVNDCIAIIQNRVSCISHASSVQNQDAKYLSKFTSFISTCLYDAVTKRDSMLGSPFSSEIELAWARLLQRRLSAEVVKHLLLPESESAKKIPRKRILNQAHISNSEERTAPGLERGNKRPSMRQASSTGAIEGPEFLRGRREFTHGNYDGYYTMRRAVLGESSNDKCLSVNSAQPSLQSEASQALNVADVPPASIDPRLRVLSYLHQSTLFTNKAILDVGCNVGILAFTMAGVLKASRVVGVDIDIKLIEKALCILRSLKYNYFFKFQIPSNQIATDEGRRPFPPISSSLTCFAHFLPALPKSKEECGDLLEARPFFPFNVEFRAEDFARFSCPRTTTPSLPRIPPIEKHSEIASYDTVLALSVTKWIHLNSGDEGIKRTFRKIYEFLKPGI